MSFRPPMDRHNGPKLRFDHCGTTRALRFLMSKSSLSISRQLIRPSKMQAWVFIVGCGLSSLVASFSTALLLSMSGEHRAMQRTHASSEEPQTSSCPSLDIHTRMERSTATSWLTLGGALGAARLEPRSLGSGLVGVQVSAIQADSPFEGAGLKDGDVIATIEGIHLFSANRDRLLRDKLASDGTHSISMALLRERCPATLEIHLI